MMTFDAILPKVAEIFQQHQADVPCGRPWLINRDLNGRVRLIMDEKWEHDDRAMAAIDKITRKIEGALGPHAYPAEDALLFESNFEEVLASEAKFSLEGIEGVYVVDRLATEGNWSSISPPNTTTPRIVFFSIKGG
ncbi:MAG: ParA family protein, partial [Rhodoferax sp.]|nr:ParA family protein [Rhodoferax sp.]